MKLYQLHSKQYLPIAKSEAWEFLSNPSNLCKITPKHMGFKILNNPKSKMYPGQMIYYNVSPFKGITMKWVSEITYVEEGKYFVDEQRFGPYSLWHHKHFIKELENGIEMEDIIDFKLPFGRFGQLFSPLVKNNLNLFLVIENKP